MPVILATGFLAGPQILSIVCVASEGLSPIKRRVPYPTALAPPVSMFAPVSRMSATPAPKLLPLGGVPATGVRGASLGIWSLGA